MIELKILDPVHIETNKEGKVNLNDCLSYEEFTWTRPKNKNKKKRRIDYSVYLIQPTFDHKWIFPTGLLPRALDFLNEHGLPYQLTGTLGTVEFDKPGIKGITFRPDQKRLIKAALVNGRGVLQAPCGTGKCHGKDTPIIMHNGAMKRIQSIQPGDLLMGPDSKPRKVLSVTKGFGSMYQVTPIKGTPFTCNGDHVLSLQCTSTMGKGVTYKKDRIINISVNDYLDQSKTFKSMTKLWRTGVDFPKKKVAVDPYIVGIYLGDGLRTRRTMITTGNQDPEVGHYIKTWTKNCKLNLREEPRNNCTNRIITSKKGLKNWFLDFVKNLVNHKGERTIPKEYLINSRKNRLKLLAGLIDTDGHYNRAAVYDLVFKDKRFVKQVAFLARSLGLSASTSKKIATIKSRNFKGTYWRLCISGNLDEIPCKVARKKATPRKQIKNHLRVGFSIEPIGSGDYFGFNLSGDHLYLLSDFTVTHNTVVLIGIISAFKKERILFLCHTLPLISQFKEELIKWGFSDIGVISGEEKTFGRIQLATIQSFSRLDPKTYVGEYDVILIDESHHLSSYKSQYAKVIQRMLAPVRIGVTATMPYKEEAKFALEGLLGPKLAELTIKEGHEIGILAKPIIKILEAPYIDGIEYIEDSKDNLKYPEVYQAGIVDNLARNMMIVVTAKNLIAKNKSTLINVNRIEHGVRIEAMGREFGIKCKFIHGADGNDTRTRVKNALESKRIKCVIASTIFKEGINIPSLDCCINAAGGKSEIATLQALGRGLRTTKTKKEVLIIDFKDTSSKYLRAHFRARYKVYKENNWV